MTQAYKLLAKDTTVTPEVSYSLSDFFQIVSYEASGFDPNAWTFEAFYGSLQFHLIEPPGSGGNLIASNPSYVTVSGPLAYNTTTVSGDTLVDGLFTVNGSYKGRAPDLLGLSPLPAYQHLLSDYTITFHQTLLDQGQNSFSINSLLTISYGNEVSRDSSPPAGYRSIGYTGDVFGVGGPGTITLAGNTTPINVAAQILQIIRQAYPDWTELRVSEEANLASTGARRDPPSYGTNNQYAFLSTYDAQTLANIDHYLFGYQTALENGPLSVTGSYVGSLVVGTVLDAGYNVLKVVAQASGVTFPQTGSSQASPANFEFWALSGAVQGLKVRNGIPPPGTVVKPIGSINIPAEENSNGPSSIFVEQLASPGTSTTLDPQGSDAYSYWSLSGQPIYSFSIHPSISLAVTSYKLEVGGNTATVSIGSTYILPAETTRFMVYGLGLTSSQEGPEVAVSLNQASGDTDVFAITPISVQTANYPAYPIGTVHRFFDSTYGTHLFTQSEAEAQTILATRPDLVEERNSFGAVSSLNPNAEPVYRFFEQSNGTHFLTASRSEFVGLTTLGASSYRPDLTYESSSTFYGDATQQTGDVAVYRLFDSVHGTQFLTGSQTEYAGLTTSGSATYRPDLTAEGIAFYAPATA